MCVLLTTQQYNKNTPERLCTGINVVNSDGCHDLKGMQVASITVWVLLVILFLVEKITV